MESPSAASGAQQQLILQQQQQIQQLTTSVGQLFNALVTTQTRLASLERSLERTSAAEGGWISRQQQQQLQEVDPQLWQSLQPPSSANVVPNMLLLGASDGGGGSHQGEEADEAPSQLNNQVPPGMRANNYWDNFRSYSRQNRLSSGGGETAAAVAAPPLSLQALTSPQARQAMAPIPLVAPLIAQQQPGPNVAQVTPRQLLSDAFDAPPQPPPPTQQQGGAAVADVSFLHQSPPRPRRKQKINREQNRPNSHHEASSYSPSSSSQLEGLLNVGGGTAMVHPMPQQQQHEVRFGSKTVQQAYYFEYF